ncbi:response regulator [Algoriphagus winogradskyi]|uniref:Response regulator receiver domain-containing protein n=1 Tax=Algoriphagus winogradskyi TaxID=237017 RepID=A0ABY1PFR2_9BACT|nr:response regulator transcription factor [Algoriphagus winogradskyi]SMP33224.1 Response regulator receiver domain-containing protein [Algoriphagus winogradskyi]
MEVQAKKRKLLLIDDEPLMGVLLKNKFKLGYEVAVKLNGLEGLSYILDGNVPDVVILDLNMPVMGGIEFIQEIRKFTYLHQIVIIVLSGEESAASRIDAFNACADDFLIKPFNMAELSIRIERFFTRYKFDKL